jgi:hypothetical protein
VVHDAEGASTLVVEGYATDIARVTLTGNGMSPSMTVRRAGAILLRPRTRQAGARGHEALVTRPVCAAMAADRELRGEPVC